MQFAPGKYELITSLGGATSTWHDESLVDTRNHYNISAKIMRILGVFLDPRLRWKGHLDAVAGKMKTQLKALTQTTASTWGLPLQEARQICMMVSRPALTYGAITWHQPRTATMGNRKLQAAGIEGKLATLQNSCLQVIAGAYKANPITTLEAETYIPPLDLQLDSVVARSPGPRTDSERLSTRGAEIVAACRRVRQSLHRSGQKQRRPLEEVIHPKPLPGAWVQQWADQGTRQAQQDRSRVASSEHTLGAEPERDRRAGQGRKNERIRSRDPRDDDRSQRR